MELFFAIILIISVLAVLIMLSKREKFSIPPSTKPSIPPLASGGAINLVKEQDLRPLPPWPSEENALARLAYHTVRADPKPAPPAPQGQKLKIAVPALAWEPGQAVGVMNTLFTLTQTGDIELVVAATSQSLTWEIYHDSANTEPIRRAILSFYPQAEIAVETAYPPMPGTTELKGAIEFFAPLLYADDQKQQDPLAAIVGAMANLEPNERIYYMLTLKKPEKNYNKEGYKKIHKSAWPGIALALTGAALNAAANAQAEAEGKSRRQQIHVHQPAGPNALDKFESRYMRLFEEKLNSPLVPATLTIDVRVGLAERKESLTAVMVSATSNLDRPDGNRLTTQKKGHPLILCPQEAAVLWHLPTDALRAPGIVRSSGASAPLPTELIRQTGGMLLGHNTYQGKRRPVYVVEPDRITHMNIVGKTRVGKTTFMHNLIHQDIAEGKGVGVIDPHGDLVANLLRCSIPPSREKDVVLFDLSDVKRSMALNLLYVPVGVPPHAAVGLTLGVMKKIFAEAWSATRMEDALYSALAVLSNQPGATIRDVPKLFYDADFRSEALAKTKDTVALEYFQEDYARMSEGYQMEVARPIMTRIRAFYRNPVIERIVAQPTSVDFRGLMDEGKIFLASLAGEATQAESAVIGALLISKLQMAAMGRAGARERPMFYLYIDEVQNFVTTSLSTMFSEAAKYGLSLTVANQFLGQLEGGTLDAILGNTGTTVMFACGSQDAEDLGKYVKPVFDSQTLMNLDRFQAVVKLQQSGKSLPAFAIETPPPPPVPRDAADRVARLRGVPEPPTEAKPAEPPPAAPSVPDLTL